MLIPLFGWASTFTPITVVNPSFETLPSAGLTNPNGPCGVACFYSIGVAIPGWTSSDVSASGQFQPGTEEGNTAYFNTLDDGITSAWSRGATLSQTVDAVVQVGTAYTLMVDLGWRLDRAFDASADLLVNGNRYMATGTVPVQGGWSTFTTTYVGLASDAGLPITIELNANGAQGNYDNVRLTDPILTPEPALAGAVGACLIGLAACLRRKANS
jgi:hypothetical protein